MFECKVCKKKIEFLNKTQYKCGCGIKEYKRHCVAPSCAYTAIADGDYCDYHTQLKQTENFKII